MVLADQRLVAFEATALRQRRPLRPNPHAREPREPGRDVARDGAMLRDACRLAAAFPNCASWILSLRITEAQAASGMLARLIADVLSESGLPPERMELEFEEASLRADESDLLLLLAALRDLGVGLALGGFGVDVSSLTLLRRRSLAGLLSQLKLHPVLVRDLGAADQDFLRGLVAIAHALGLRVVAEGIDTDAQFARLREAGCDQGLGGWLGEAQPAREAVRALREGSSRVSLMK